jgi:hypothetical protein
MEATEQRDELEGIKVQQVCHIIGTTDGLCGEPERCRAFCDCLEMVRCPGCGRVICPDCKARMPRMEA